MKHVTINRKIKHYKKLIKALEDIKKDLYKTNNLKRVTRWRKQRRKK